MPGSAGRRDASGAWMSSRAVTGGREWSHGRSIRSAAISARMTPIGRLSPAARAMSAYCRTTSTHAAAFQSGRSMISRLMPSPVGWWQTSARLAASSAAPIQGSCVELREGPADPHPELGDGEVPGDRQDLGLDRGDGLGRRGPEQVDERAHLAHVDPALVERAPGAAQLRGEDERLDEQRLGLDLGTAADERQLGDEAFRSSPPARPAAGAGCRGPDRRGDRNRRSR